MKLKYTLFVTTLLICLCGPGCKNLKHVHEFSTVSIEAIDQFKTIPYSYYRYCKDACDLEKQTAIITGKIQFRPSDTATCNCNQELKKDQDATKAYTALILYFTSLKHLSDRSKFIYQSGSMVGALSKLKVIEDPNLQGPVTKIADIILNLSTRAYRSRSLQKTLNDSKTPIDKLLNALILNNRILQGKYKGYYGSYLSVMMEKYTGEHVQPRQQLDDYISNSREIEKSKFIFRQIEDFSALLEKVKTGHLQLADERSKLKDKELIIYLYTQSQELKANLLKL